MDESRSAAAAQRVAPQGPDPLIGRMVNDRYRIVGLIARGGMGKVYRAEQHPLGRLVALKVLHTNYTGDSDPEFHKRFFLEASIASKLTHPNTVTIFDYGKTDDDVYYIAMELLEGRTLHRSLREEGTFTAERTMHIARQICRSLREAHGMGVIHRDLKPANVYLLQHGDERDVVKVLDFGLVKNLEDKGEELTQTGLFMGSPKYMSPEQIRGDKCDGRVDVYALGVMMFEMLTGKVPYDRPNSVHILMAHIQEDIPPLGAFNPSVRVPPALEAVVRKCMAKNVDERYATMDELLAALKRVSGIHATMTGELRAVDLAELSRSMELPVPSVVTGRGELLSSGKSSLTPLEPTSTPANNQTLVDRTWLQSSPVIAPAPAPTVEAKRQDNRLPFVLGMAVALVLGGGGMWLVSKDAPPPVVEAKVEPVVEPVVAPPAAPEQPPPEQQTVLVSLKSTPAGAMVVVGDKEYGPTPTQVEWTGEEARIGREVTVRFTRRGFRNLTVTRQIRGPELLIDAPPMDAAPPEAPPTPRSSASKQRPAAAPMIAPPPAAPSGYRASPY